MSAQINFSFKLSYKTGVLDLSAESDVYDEICIFFFTSL